MSKTPPPVDPAQRAAVRAALPRTAQSERYETLWKRGAGILPGNRTYGTAMRWRPGVGFDMVSLGEPGTEG